MFKTFINAWKVPDLRKKILYTALILLVFRIGAAIPVPFLNITGALVDPTAGGGATFMNYLVMMTGDAFNYGTIFAMSVTPYINASIIIELLTVAIPALENLAKEGEEGRKKISRITRFTAVGLALLQSVAYFIYLKSKNYLTTDINGSQFTGFSLWMQGIVVVAILTAGSALVTWLGDRIDERGIGNGISMMLFVGIVSRIPTMVTTLYQYFDRGGIYYAAVSIFVVCMFLLIAFIVWMDNAEQRIPVQYAKRVVGRKMYGGQNSHIPLKVNMTGVLPIIFASSILSLPPTINLFIGAEEGNGWYDHFFKFFNSDSWVYGILYFLLIIFFDYFYAAIQYNPVEMANNLRKNSGAIPGIRPGKPTADYLQKIMNKLILLGALLLSVVALFPIVYSQISKAVGADMAGVSLGGTSIIILVGVALETQRQLESQLMMRHYKGFLD